MIFVFSLAGLPPLAGWYAKFAMFSAAITAGGTGAIVLAAIAAVNAVIAFYYYARVVKTLWFDEPPAGAAPITEGPAGSLGLAMGIAAVLTVVIGFYPTIAGFFGEATDVLITAAGG